MSLDTVPKTNFESDDGMLFTDANEIGANLQALEDSKHQDGDSPSYVDITASGDIAGADISTTTQTTTTSNITNLNVGNINPNAMTAANVVITNGNSWTPSAGFYIIENLSSSSVLVQINSSGFKDTQAGSFFTNGSLVRVRNTSGGDVTLFYLKL